MILYFDNYITSEPFYTGGHMYLDSVRKSKAKIYHAPSKMDITLYTLASYAILDWSKVIIKYELEDLSQKKRFEKEVLKLFPHAILIYGRSNSQKKFQETINLINSFDDDWIFYVGNNDHPFMAPNKETLDACLEKAKKIALKNRYVSIPVSHFIEFYNYAVKGTPFHEIKAPSSKILEQDKDMIVALFPKGMYFSVQVIHKKLLNHWFFSGDAGSTIVRRSDCIEPFSKKVRQIVVIPKKEICAHFDALLHTDKTPFNTSYDICPPLFIPPGFFEKNIKIRFGFEDYKEGYVNINPLKEKYSFMDRENGTDLKIGLEDIPLFWKKRIKKIEVNKDADISKINEAVKKIGYLQRNPFPKKSSFYYTAYRLKHNFFILIYKIPFIRKPALYLMSKSKKVRGLYIGLIKVKF